ncbi:MAG: FRG domain-containing protein [Verrucomicrobiota bacterium]
MREIENIFVESLDAFLNEMVPRLGFQRNPIYRGQASDQWKLLPSLFREEVTKTEFKNWSELEGALLLSLKQKARGELGYEPMTELEWMSMGEHYGLPTRFSTWSENALVALFFATAPHCDDDGVVWRILPGDTDLAISQDYEQIPERPRVYTPQKMTPSMLNQKTCYLSHPLPAEGAKPRCFEDCFESGTDRLHLARIVIPATEKEYIRRRLVTMGIDHRTLFPGMAGLCGQIREEIYSHTDSFEWVFPGE